MIFRFNLQKIFSNKSEWSCVEGEDEGGGGGAAFAV